MVQNQVNLVYLLQRAKPTANHNSPGGTLPTGTTGGIKCESGSVGSRPENEEKCITTR
jgi:hypothetical protein